MKWDVGNMGPPGSSAHGDSPGKNTGVGCPCPPPGDLPNLGIKPRYPALQVDFLPSEPWGKPNNTGVGSLSLLQGNFPTQESNQALLNCRQFFTSWLYSLLKAILWPPDVKNWLIGKDPDAGKDWRQEEKGTTEDQMVGWHHQLEGHEFEQASGVGDGQESLACCSPWGHKESERTEWLNWTESCI